MKENYIGLKMYHGRTTVDKGVFFRGGGGGGHGLMFILWHFLKTAPFELFDVIVVLPLAFKKNNKLLDLEGCKFNSESLYNFNTFLVDLDE